MHPGRTATIVLDGQTIGFLGQVHPQTAKNYGIPETYVAEINLNVISPFFLRLTSPIKKFLMLLTLLE